MTETLTTDEPIHACIARWHDHMRGRLDGGLDAMLHPDVVFLSPIVFTPQEGREITKLYLTAAGGTLGGDDRGRCGDSAATSGSGGGFRYTKEICQGHSAMLEFETSDRRQVRQRCRHHHL